MKPGANPSLVTIGSLTTLQTSNQRLPGLDHQPPPINTNNFTKNFNTVNITGTNPQRASHAAAAAIDIRRSFMPQKRNLERDRALAAASLIKDARSLSELGRHS